MEPNLFCDTVLIPGVTYNNDFEGDLHAGAVKIYKESQSEQKDPGKPAEDFKDENSSNELIDLLLNNAYRKSKKIYQVTENSCPYDKAEKNLSLAVQENRRDRQASALACLVNEGTVLTDTVPLTSSTIKDKTVDIRTAARKKHVYPNVVLASVEAFAEMLKAAGKEYTPNTNDKIVTSGQVGTWLNMLWIEADALDGTAKYYDYTGTLKTVNLSEVELVMYQFDTFHVVDNLTMMRLKDSENFTGVKAQNEINTGFRVTNKDKVVVKKKSNSVSYTITYDANGGTGTIDPVTYTGTPITLDDGSSLTGPDGKTVFKGWAKSAGAQNPTVDSPFTPTADVTLYAVWAAE